MDLDFESQLTVLDCGNVLAGVRVETLDSAGLRWSSWSRLETSVTSIAGKLTGAEKGETGTEPFLLGKALPPRLKESSPLATNCEWDEVLADEDLVRLWSLVEWSLFELRKMFLNDDMRGVLKRRGWMRRARPPPNPRCFLDDAPYQKVVVEREGGAWLLLLVLMSRQERVRLPSAMLTGPDSTSEPFPSAQ